MAKANLTFEEAARYSGIGISRLRELINQTNCNYVLFIGAKQLIKRKQFEKFLETVSVL